MIKNGEEYTYEKNNFLLVYLKYVVFGWMWSDTRGCKRECTEESGGHKEHP
jgi:hypothetical protein